MHMLQERPLASLHDLQQEQPWCVGTTPSTGWQAAAPSEAPYFLVTSNFKVVEEAAQIV